MRVLAIDPGTIKMGYGFLTNDSETEVVDYGVVTLSRYTDIGERLFQLFTHVRNMISIFQPDAVAVEEPFIGRGERQFIGPAIAVGQAQAVVLIGAASAGVEVFRYSPAEVKRAVADYGAATKDQMQRALAATLRLDTLPDSDAADALSVGLCHLIKTGERSALAREITPGSER
ncbi:MAG: crossover junction endodeoxyribonuclease RuvC [Chloroflexi bacterium]|nr:crossover junction endodeoxyribonuclease RuvC [Chloroflexota bacterium]